MPLPNTAIIGAGPAGLTLARLLQVHGLPFTVFELRAEHDKADQGGTLDLHPRGGQRALAQAGLTAEFERVARPEGQATKLVRFDGEVLWDENVTGVLRPSEGERPEVDRVVLRDLLQGSVGGEHFRWGRKLREVRPQAGEGAEGKYELCFADGGVEGGFDLVVGADGAWSKVRPLLTEVKPFYSGVSIVEMWALGVAERKAWVGDYVGEGSMFMFDEGRAIMAQRNGNGSVRTYAGVRQDEGWMDRCEIDWKDGKVAREKLVEGYFQDCSEELKRLVFESDDATIPRKTWMLPVGLEWESRAGVTLIGDAAHLMTPFAGVGVNLGMVDALELANALVSRKDVFVATEHTDSSGLVLESIQAYEKAMFERTKGFAEKTMKGLVDHFSANGGDKRAMRFREFVESQERSKK